MIRKRKRKSETQWASRKKCMLERVVEVPARPLGGARALHVCIIKRLSTRPSTHHPSTNRLDARTILHSAALNWGLL